MMVRLFIAGLVAAAAVVTFACAGGTASPGATSTPAGTPQSAATIRAVKTLKYDRDSLTLSAGQPVTVRFVNEDTGVPHDFAVYRDAAHTQLVAKTDICTAPCDEQLQLNLASGEYHFMCTVHPQQMEGMIIAR
jgi:plastocyanin